LFAPIVENAFGVGVFVSHKEPETDGNLRAVEELAGEGDHAVHEVGLVKSAADVAFAGLIREHAAVGEDKFGRALRGEVVDDMPIWPRLLRPLGAPLGNRRVHVVAELVGGEPKLGLKADGGA